MRKILILIAKASYDLQPIGGEVISIRVHLLPLKGGTQKPSKVVSTTK